MTPRSTIPLIVSFNGSFHFSFHVSFPTYRSSKSSICWIHFLPCFHLAWCAFLFLFSWCSVGFGTSLPDILMAFSVGVWISIGLDTRLRRSPQSPPFRTGRVEFPENRRAWTEPRARAAGGLAEHAARELGPGEPRASSRRVSLNHDAKNARLLSGVACHGNPGVRVPRL